jgi:hypothetical protein
MAESSAAESWIVGVLDLLVGAGSSILGVLSGELTGVVSGVILGVVFLTKGAEHDKGGERSSEDTSVFSCGLHGSGPVKGAGEVAAKGGLW